METKMDKIICVGKNYLLHAKELGDAVPESPVIFLKPPSTICWLKDQLDLEWKVQGTLHHELELVFEIRRTLSGSWGFSRFTIGLDMTLRDRQAELKKNGHPWERAKVFAGACVVGPWQNMTDLESVLKKPFELEVDGEIRQKATGEEMRWKPDELLRDLEAWLPLCDGDILFTGTPHGVGPVGSKKCQIRFGPGLRLSLQSLPAAAITEAPTGTTNKHSR